MEKKKPIVSWYKNFDPCNDTSSWQTRLTDINIINTRNLTDDFVEFCASNKNKIFLHVYISGMGNTAFEPKIPTVKQIFLQVMKLLEKGFPQKQILIVINPILSNDNGLKALKLLLRILTEFKGLKLRWLRMNLLHYKPVESLIPKEKLKVNNQFKFGGKFVIANDNILKRTSEIKQVMPYLFKQDAFYREYNNLIIKYKSIINIDSGDEYSIGIRELMAFGYNNVWEHKNGIKTNIITYENNNRFKPNVNILSKGGTKTFRCLNRCKLCPYIN